MKKNVLLFLLVILGTNVWTEEIIIYGPASMKWIEKKYGNYFKKKTGDTIKFVSIDGILGKLKLEKRNPKADVVVGVTEITAKKALKENLIVPYVPKNISMIKKKEYKMYSNAVVPMDYGFLAINYNKKTLPNPPKNLKEISLLKKQLIIENPTLSITGKEILQWSIALYGDNFEKFWTYIKPAVYSIEAGWTEAFTKFTTDESPMMVGYATSNLFFVGENSKFDSFLLDEGSYIYQEAGALVNKPNVKIGAKNFMEEILSKEFQKLIVSENYMFPVIDINLPEKFKSIPIPKLRKTLKLSEKQIDDFIKNEDLYEKRVLQILKE